MAFDPATQQLFQDTLDGVHAWIPSQAHDHEKEFQKELHAFLDEYLNEQQSGMMGMGLGGNTERSVRRERGASRGDVVVNDTVGIEMKRDLSNSQTKKLRGQIDDYADNYPYVIVCACGIDDMGGWRELKNKFDGQYGDLADTTEIAFVHKKKANYGKDPTDSGDGGDGLLGGGGLW